MNFDDALERLAAEEDARCDLAELAFLLARDEYADLDVDAYLCELNGMAREARNYLGGDLESRVKGRSQRLKLLHGETGQVEHLRGASLEIGEP